MTLIAIEQSPVATAWWRGRGSAFLYGVFAGGVDLLVLWAAWRRLRRTGQRFARFHALSLTIPFIAGWVSSAFFWLASSRGAFAWSAVFSWLTMVGRVTGQGLLLWALLLPSEEGERRSR